ncbi:MAG: mandelate racemase/muconate lactonizing enzyme family protein [SAR202 cluster bacterium]|nr:mandelate racemase/muconate lactonizing enzyme family protein [SAR202 cluster bacterium]
MKITKIEVRAVAPPADQFTWSDDLPNQYATNTVVRVLTDDGKEGVGGVWNATSYGFERYTAEAIRHLAPVLIGKDPLNREQIGHDIRPRVFPVPPQALAALDIALWDLTGKAAGLPLYQLLGGARDRIASYASTPLYDSVEEYVDRVEVFRAEGYRAVKFHTWCIPESDLKLARAIRKRFPGSDIAFMLDAENNYVQADAIRVARELEDLGFLWFEAPLPDYDLEGYRAITRATTIPVLPSGNWIQDLHFFSEALRTGCWRSTRTDVAMMGGITRAQKAIALTEAAGINCEIMSWGYSLVAAANLHLMLAHNNCTFFEQSVPYEAYGYGMKDVIRTGSDGMVHAPRAPGLGLEVDWPMMDRATIHRIDVGS